MWAVRAISRAARKLRARRPRPAILVYHRVSSVRHDPWGLAVSPKRFEEQIAYIKRHRTVMSMEEFVGRLRSRTLPSDAVAVTFDDGYRDNLINAKPVLLRHNVPATVFVATSYIDRNAPFWWDELAAMILESPRPAHHHQKCEGEMFTFDWLETEPADADGKWQAYEEPVSSRQRIFVATWRKLKHATPEKRELVMDALRLRLETSPQDPLRMPMRSDEIRSLLSGDVVALGAHSVTHSALTGLSRFDCRREVTESRQRCRSLTSNGVDGFAYPYGDMSSEVREDVAAEGFGWACSTEKALIDNDRTSLYALPRIAVPNSPMSVFVKLITG